MILAVERLAEAFTVAVKTAGPESAVGPAGAPVFSPPPLPASPISGPSASALVDSAVSSAIDLIKVWTEHSVR